MIPTSSHRRRTTTSSVRPQIVRAVVALMLEGILLSVGEVARHVIDILHHLRMRTGLFAQ